MVAKYPTIMTTWPVALLSPFMSNVWLSCRKSIYLLSPPQLLQTSVAMMRAAGEGGSAASGRVPSSQLLLVLSDGVFSEDPQSPRVQAAVRLAREHNLFIVCVIIDDAKKKVRFVGCFFSLSP